MNSTTEELQADPAKKGWSYSRYRATLCLDGQPFAIVSPNGLDALSIEAEKTLMGLLEPRLLRVTLGQEDGLVSLATGEVLALSDSAHHIHVGSHIPKVVLSETEASRRLGTPDSCEWADVVRYLQEHYDWEHKYLP